MPWLLLLILLAVLILGPGMWVKRVMKRYSQPADRYPGTGAQLARHLLDSFELGHVGTEETAQGDHYDPAAKVVRLTPDKYSGCSLTAITVAAHEVGHAVQDAYGYRPLKWRTRLVRVLLPIEKAGAGMLMVSPFLVMITRVPYAGLLTFFGGLLTLGSAVVVHLLTLPTEFDASFVRALPMLRSAEILKPEDERHARRLLTAAALTYVSASLLSLLNIARWWAILRR